MDTTIKVQNWFTFFDCQLRLDKLMQLFIRYQVRGCAAQPDQIVL